MSCSAYRPGMTSSMTSRSVMLLLISALAHISIGGIYIPRRQYNFFIPPVADTPDLTIKIPVLENSAVQCEPRQANFLTTLSDFVDTAYENNAIVLRFIGNVNASISDEPVTFDVTITCDADTESKSHNYYRQFLTTSVTIVIQATPTELPPDFHRDTVSGQLFNANVTKQLCFGGDLLAYNVTENDKNVRLDVISGYRKLIMPEGLEATLIPKQDNTVGLSVDSTSQEVTLIRALDREEQETHTVPVLCKLTYKGSVLFNKSYDATIHVIDVDDNVPMAMQGRKILVPLDVRLLNNNPKSSQLTLLSYDPDSLALADTSTFAVTLNDSATPFTLKASNFFKIPKWKQERDKKKPSATIIRTVLLLKPVNPSFLPYVVDVTIEDLTYTPSLTATPKKNMAIHRLVVQSQTSDEVIRRDLPTIRMDVAATRYSLVVRLEEEPEKVPTNVSYRIVTSNPEALKRVLAVTNSGDVYVNEVYNLTRYKGINPILAVVTKTDSGQEVERIAIRVELADTLREGPGDECRAGCSAEYNEEDCVTSCGYGAISGRCSWREGDTTMSANYSTCTPNLDTCPDGICSELEVKDFLICPQDCSQESMTGQLLRWPLNRGIFKAKGPCWCDGDRYCQCGPLKLPPGHTNYSFSGTAGHREKSGQHDPLGADPNPGDDEPACSSSCRAAIASSVTVVVLLVLLVVVLRWTAWRRQRRRQSMSLKHVNSLVSMAAVPSDYIVDDSREQRAHAHRQTSSASSLQWPPKVAFGQDVFEDKWEFPRHCLTLEHVLGEGEFGQVVRAQAHMLRPQEESSVVAVKMLKPEASGAEYQDLVSEFQLLKEVDHPNVIKLLGVCTLKGPLYVIVEFCELGSLRSFLRASKFKNKGSWEDKQRSGNDPSMISEKNETRILTFRDLFSFAWQISKGMDYLSGLKIVHRDLAARNVLVTEGMKMKISDFGLSRDVYEADTYLKMSKGRIPVKWMAPESLYAQIYTTKSDIWSYGVVLWEVVTLGASPYPGIPPERLFPLLSTGYRMDRPDDCPEELYAIMQKCWKTEPEHRPSFFMLTDILDSLLQQNTEYLELADEHYFTHNAASDRGDRVSRHPTPSFPDDRHYGNLCPVTSLPATQPDAYVRPEWSADESDDESRLPESSKLLTDPHADTQKTKQADTDKFKGADDASVDTSLLNDCNTDTTHKHRVLVHENLTYV
ncbi:uncharacterized protein LOC101846195 [Aplysia californica]|uniref:Uncharacterized protein LOC101846195 n=1 Tax=Aplysia californica TaxID=6500 RepID=A0ABM0ZUN4_APLCA|nr:uncharacterized protein LOC101846195 [Aplysia californica]